MINGLSFCQIEELKMFYEVHTGEKAENIENYHRLNALPKPEVYRLDELIKLGLWAEKIGIPALKKHEEYRSSIIQLCHEFESPLDTLPGKKGEFYPCKPDIFEATYEVVE